MECTGRRRQHKGRVRRKDILKVFIGYDRKESIAYHVCSHSILKRSFVPVSITPLNQENLLGFFSRKRGEYDSTDFAITRFLCPYLCDYEGFSIFLDGDMLVLGDISELGKYMTPMDQYNFAVRVVKHDYTPRDKTKFLGQMQTKYEKKNWSSVMIFNNALCRNLTLDYVQKAHGLDLHQFKWCEPHQIAELPKEWNWLVGEPGYENGKNLKLIHYTKGTPCFPEYRDCEFSDLWHKEYEDATSCA